MDLNYNDASHAHAVTHIGTTQKCWYDQNGNQITRIVGANTYTLSYDAENRLTSVTGPSLTASFVYDGDGRRVKSTVNGTTTYFVGAHYEVTGSTVTKYYFAGIQRVAMRTGSTLTYLLGDHLGSASVVTNASGALLMETRYKPWGEVRFATSDQTLPTRYTYTGQYSYINDEATDLGSAGFGLMFYNARWYDPYITQFSQPDSIIPGGVQGLDRYAYVNNSPVNYTDPSGHMCVPEDVCAGSSNGSDPSFNSQYGISFTGDWSERNMGIVRTAVRAVGAALLRDYKIECKVMADDCVRYSAAGLFAAVYGTSAKNPLILQWGCSECNGAGGFTYSSHKIGFASLAEPTTADGGYKTDSMAFREAVNNAVHELGHAFAKRWYHPDGMYDPSGPLATLPSGLVNNNDGFYLYPQPDGASLTWRQHPYPCYSSPNPYCGSEDFADMFLGWTYGKWGNDGLGLGQRREIFMNQNMGAWIVNLVSP